MQDTKIAAAVLGFGTAAVWTTAGMGAALVCVGAAAACGGIAVVAQRRGVELRHTRPASGDAARRPHPYAKYARGKKLSEGPRVRLVEAQADDGLSLSLGQHPEPAAVERVVPRVTPAEERRRSEAAPSYGW
jgi:hypothetical protein